MNNSKIDYENVEYLTDDFEFAPAHTNNNRIDMEYEGYWKGVLKRFLTRKRTIFALITIILISLLAIVGPIISGYSYSEQNIELQNMPPRIPGIEKIKIFDGTENNVNKYKTNSDYENEYYWFGSDNLGRDIWTRVWTGTRISLYIVIIAVFMDLCIGMGYGLISGYFGGKLDFAMQRFVEIINSIPTLVVITLLLVVLKPGLSTITLALMITGWIGMSRVARAQVIKNKDLEYVLAVKTLGVGRFSIIFREILPNVIGQLITNTIFSISDAIFTEAFLSFVGLGVPAPMASLGALISDGYNSFLTHPYQIVSPVLILVLLMLSFNILADNLRDALEPRITV